MLTVGAVVRRKFNFKVMVVLIVEGEKALCCWYSDSGFKKEWFDYSTLKVIIPHSNHWPIF